MCERNLFCWSKHSLHSANFSMTGLQVAVGKLLVSCTLLILAFFRFIYTQLFVWTVNILHILCKNLKRKFEENLSLFQDMHCHLSINIFIRCKACLKLLVRTYTLLQYKVKSSWNARKNGLYNAWQVLASQQVCYNAPMIRDMKPLCVSVYTFSFGRFVFHRITPRIKIHHLDP